MERRVIHRAPGLVEVYCDPGLGAVCLKWFSEYDEQGRVREAVLAAVEWVRENGVRHWIADVSTSKRALSEADDRWIGGDEFRGAILSTPLGKFVLIPPRPESGQDVAWIGEWEAGTLARFGDAVRGKICADMGEARAFPGVGAG